jgi:hypothetical protein
MLVKPENLQLEHVQWIDSHGHDGWCFTHELDFDSTKNIDTVGWVVYENEHTLTVAAHWTDKGDQLGGVISIPHIAITNRRVLANLASLRKGAELFEVLPEAGHPENNQL